MNLKRIIPTLLASALIGSTANYLFAADDNSSTPPVMPVTNTVSTANVTNAPTVTPNAIGFHDEAAIFSAIDQTQTTANANNEPPDIHQSYNRSVYNMNNAFDKGLIVPIANFYVKVMPRPLQRMIHNFYNNIDLVPTTINDVLQANFYQASNDMWRLTLNTTVGLGGTFDVASHTGLQANHEDFGLTMARWGWTKSSYFMLPVLGPNTVRDVLGRPVDFYVFSVYPYINPWYVSNGIYVLGLLDTRVQLLQYDKLFDQAAIDPYVLMRDSYYQLRNAKIEANRHLSNPNTPAQTNSYRDPFYLYQSS